MLCSCLGRKIARGSEGPESCIRFRRLPNIRLILRLMVNYNYPKGLEAFTYTLDGFEME